MKETVVVGGGLAGGAVATMLAQTGRRVRLFERDSEPVDKVCGEFLSVEAQRVLAGLGLDLDRHGASRITTLRLASGRRTIEVPLPFVARGLSRKQLDMALLEQAAGAGARIQRGVTVRSIGTSHIETELGSISPDVLLIASGKHDVRGARRPVEGCDTGYVGFKMHWRLALHARKALESKIDVILFDGGYAGLQMVEAGVANLCMLVTKRRLSALGGSWAGLLEALLAEPHAAGMLVDAEPCFAKPLTIAGVPYGFLDSGLTCGGAFRLGDQAAVIPSFCGEGMAIALHSAAAAASVIEVGGCAADHRAILRRDVAPGVRLATALQRVGQRPWPQRLIFALLRRWPDTIDMLVRHTRVRETRFRDGDIQSPQIS